METFTFDPRRWWIARVFSRNPLVRRTDRFEAFAIMVAVVMSLSAIAVAGPVGTAVYESHARRYIQQAQERHVVTATITDVGRELPDPQTGTAVVQAGWKVNGGVRTASFRTEDPVKVGDHLKIWVDTNENNVEAPRPTSVAGFDAAGVSVSIAVLAIAVTAALFAAARWRLDRIRSTQMEREIKTLVG